MSVGGTLQRAAHWLPHPLPILLHGQHLEVCTPLPHDGSPSPLVPPPCLSATQPAGCWRVAHGCRPPPSAFCSCSCLPSVTCSTAMSRRSQASQAAAQGRVVVVVVWGGGGGGPAGAGLAAGPPTYVLAFRPAGCHQAGSLSSLAEACFNGRRWLSHAGRRCKTTGRAVGEAHIPLSQPCLPACTRAALPLAGRRCAHPLAHRACRPVWRGRRPGWAAPRAGTLVEEVEGRLPGQAAPKPRGDRTSPSSRALGAHCKGVQLETLVRGSRPGMV